MKLLAGHACAWCFVGNVLMACDNAVSELMLLSLPAAGSSAAMLLTSVFHVTSCNVKPSWIDLCFDLLNETINAPAMPTHEFSLLFSICVFFTCRPAMTSILDSEAHMARRLEETGMSQNGVRSLNQAGLTTLGRLAFAHGQPGVALNETAFAAFAQNILGALMTLGDQATLKRLLFESHTMTLSQLKEAITNPEASHTRRVPAVEREAKLTRLRNQLAGVLIERQLEPAHSLLDAAAQQWESRQLLYLDPSKCQSREYEIAMGKTAKQIHLDAEKLTIKEKHDLPAQQGMNELQTQEALKRRGIAYAFADVISWHSHERYLSKLFGHLHRDPPSGFSRPTLQQILKADRAVFTKLIQDNVPVRRDPMTNVLALDTELEAALSHYDVAFNLIPLPKQPAGKPEAPKQPQSNPPRFQPYAQQPKGKGKAKGKGKSKQLLPKVFWNRDCVSVDPQGRRLCFNYALNKCPHAPDGGECRAGHHLCMRRGCQAPHPEQDHDRLTGQQTKWLSRADKLKGQPFAHAIVLEVFARSGRISAHLRKLGLVSCFGVDRRRSPKVAAPVCTADLSTAEGIRLLYQWLSNPNIVGLFLSPPSETASRARAVPPKGVKRKFGADQAPLRSDKSPNGLQGLSFSNRLRVSKANRLFHLTVQLCEYALQHGLLVVVESPQSSLFWKTSFWLSISNRMLYTIFDGCQYGSRRQKKTMIAHNDPAFLALAKLCPGEGHQHTHARRSDPARRFTIAEETERPFALAACFAHAFAKALLATGLQPPAACLADIQIGSLQYLQIVRAQSGSQPKPSRLAPLIPEFQCIVYLQDFPDKLPNSSVTRLDQPVQLSPTAVVRPQCALLPAGAKSLPVTATITSAETPLSTIQAEMGDDVKMDGDVVQINSPPQGMISQKWGIPWSPIQFVQEACRVGHPRSLKSLLPKQLLDCVAFYAKAPVATRCAFRAAKIKHWVQCVGSLSQEEASIKQGMPAHLRELLGEKRIALWRKLLVESHYSDLTVVDEMINGTLL